MLTMSGKMLSGWSSPGLAGLQVCPLSSANASHCRTAHRLLLINHRLVGLVVKASALGAEDPGFKSRLRRDFSGSCHTGDLQNGTPGVTLPGIIGSAQGRSARCQYTVTGCR